MGGIKTKLDLEQLRNEIRNLKWGTSLYVVLKEELTKIDHWKQQKRGNPIKALHDRDYNAAKNIKRVGQTQQTLTCDNSQSVVCESNNVECQKAIMAVIENEK